MNATQKNIETLIASAKRNGFSQHSDKPGPLGPETTFRLKTKSGVYLLAIYPQFPHAQLDFLSDNGKDFSMIGFAVQDQDDSDKLPVSLFDKVFADDLAFHGQSPIGTLAAI